MGNYRNIETDFVERTLRLISQYESDMHKYENKEQFNNTLLINCLLGLIVFPNARAISYLPKEKLNSKLKGEMGVLRSHFNPDIKDLKALINSLRNSIAHFDIHFESDSDELLIDRILFKDKTEGDDYTVATFIPSELLSFIRYYGEWYVSIIREYKEEMYAQE